MSDQIPSRLAPATTPRGAPRGIGSALAVNQKAAGTANPEAAAAAAGRSEADLQAEEDAHIAAEAARSAKIEDLCTSVLEGVWRPEWASVPDEFSALKARFGVHDDTAIDEWHTEMSAAYDARIKAEDERLVRDTLALSTLDPANPQYNPMMDAARREAIEATLTPISFEEMLFEGRARQTVRLHQHLEVVLSTVRTKHELWLEQMMAEKPETSVQHMRHTFSTMQLAASLDQVNGKPIGTISLEKVTDYAGFQQAITARSEYIGRLPSAVTDDLIVQMIWFFGRVRRLVAGNTMRKVGN